MKLFVGNLPFSVDESVVRELFDQHYTVMSFNMINDRETGRPRGFGFIEMSVYRDVRFSRCPMVMRRTQSRH